MKSLQHVLDVVKKYDEGATKLNEEVVECQRLLRESKVLGELEGGNVYVLKYVADEQLYALSNYNTGTLTYISTYDEYLDNKEREDQ